VAAKNSELSKRRIAFRQAVGEDVSRRVSFVEDDICSSSLDTESVDAILSWEVLEHVKHPARALEQMSRVLKPGGDRVPRVQPILLPRLRAQFVHSRFPLGTRKTLAGGLRAVSPGDPAIRGRGGQKVLSGEPESNDDYGPEKERQ